MRLRHCLFFVGLAFAVGLSSCVSEAEFAQREAARVKAVEKAEQARKAAEAERERKAREAAEREENERRLAAERARQEREEAERARKAAEAERERKAREAEQARKAAEAERERKAREADKKEWIESVMKAGEKTVNSLRKLVSGNSDLSEEKRAQGNALLEAFIGEYLPNYSDRYKAARIAALEKQSAFCDLLDALQLEKVNLSQNKIFQNFLGGYYDAAREYFELRSGLVDLYAQHKIGVLSSEDLASVDSKNAERPRK